MTHEAERSWRHQAAEIEPQSIASAVTQVVDAGERLVSHRLELAIVELRQAIEGFGRSARSMLVTLLLAGSGWIFAMIALLAWLEAMLGTRAGAAAVVAALQLVLCGVLIATRRRTDASP